MPVRRVQSNPRVAENAGRVALMRGPLLYCVEAAENPHLDPRRVVLEDGDVEAAERPDLLGGVVALTGGATAPAVDDGWGDALYRPAGLPTDAPRERIEVTAIPYHAWANREPGPMAVWLRDRT